MRWKLPLYCSLVFLLFFSLSIIFHFIVLFSPFTLSHLAALFLELKSQQFCREGSPQGRLGVVAKAFLQVRVSLIYRVRTSPSLRQHLTK